MNPRSRSLTDSLSELLRAYRWTLRLRGLSLESGVIVKSPSRLAFGPDCTIQRQAILHGGGRAWSNYEGAIRLGRGVVVGPRCILYGAGGIEIGDYTHLGPGAMLMTQEGRHAAGRVGPHPTYRFEPIVLGRGVWIGAGAIVLGGSRLGDECSVAPNALVRGDYGPGSVLVGNPARLLRIEVAGGDSAT